MEQNPAVERDFFMVFAKSRLALNIVFMQYISYDYASLIVPMCDRGHSRHLVICYEKVEIKIQ